MELLTKKQNRLLQSLSSQTAHEQWQRIVTIREWTYKEVVSTANSAIEIYVMEMMMMQHFQMIRRKKVQPFA